MKKENNRKKSAKLKVGFLKNINKIDKPLARLRKKNSNKLRDERGNFITKIKRIKRDYCEQLHTNELDLG